jgi:hypothetical protein
MFAAVSDASAAVKGHSEARAQSVVWWSVRMACLICLSLQEISPPPEHSPRIRH